jgi:Golgi phosphoprotein 3 GPP34
MPTLPEDLVILAVGLKPRSGPATGAYNAIKYAYGMRGAVLVALTLTGRVEVRGGLIVVRDATPVGEPGIDQLLAELAAVGGATVADWMLDLPGGFVTAYYQRMEAAGILRSVPVRVLYIAKRPGYFLNDPARFEQLRVTLHAAVTSPGPLEPAQAALAGLVYAADLASLAYPGKANAPLRARLAELAGVSPAAAQAVAASAASHRADTSVEDDPMGRAELFSAGPEPMRSVIDAAVHAAVSSSVSAAVSAAAGAAHHSHSSGSSSGSSPSHHHH